MIRMVAAIKTLDYSDLKADPVVMFQRRMHPWLDMFMAFILPPLIACYGWGEDYWNALFVCGFLRFIITLHITFCVNSFAHFFGDRPYDPNTYPADNKWVALVAAGEGWHNWHHKYPYDYAASEFGALKQFNTAKIFIDFFAAIGLVTDR